MLRLTMCPLYIGRVGFEPTRGLPRRILSPLRLPFRHRPSMLEPSTGFNVIKGLRITVFYRL